MKVGICGFPGSGKTTVFSALAPGSSGGSKGVTFGNIKVPDARVDKLASVFNPKRCVFAEITFMDVGGVGRMDGGAFPPDVVQNMRNADVLVHVVRAFPNSMLPTPANPARDESNFNDELVLIDLSVLERRQQRFRKENRKGLEMDVNERCVACLEDGRPLRDLQLDEAELETLTGIQLLSLRPLITLYNLSEDAWEDPEHADWRELRERGADHVSLGISGEIEAELAELEGEELQEMLEGLGLEEPARNQFIQAAYRLLDLISFLTAGHDECRAWPIRRGTVAKKAAGKVHSDIERGFIRASVYRWEDLLEHGSEAALKGKGLIRLEGKEYVMQDGDVVDYRFNV